MQSLTESILESKDRVFREVQSDVSKGACYSSIDTVEGSRKYKYGFLTFNQYQEFVGLVAFNKVEDLQDLLDTDDDEFSSLLGMKPQEYKVVDNVLYVKLW